MSARIRDIAPVDVVRQRGGRPDGITSGAVKRHCHGSGLLKKEGLSILADFSYRPKQYNLSGLIGISDQTLERHVKLYEGYVRETNRLTDHIAQILKDGTVDQEEMPAYSELTRRLGFEYNGMVLHEYYFDNVKRDGSGDPSLASAFLKEIESSFGSYAVWKTDFSSIAKMRGVGWAICYRNPMNGRLSNHWITLHETGNVAGVRPLLVLDVWEHAVLLDYKPSERGKYIEAFFSNIDWDVVEERLGASMK
ncbi:MAG: superoxide dismutase [Nitrospirota bacterium]